MKIAIIGTGNVGSALAKGFTQAGHEVLLGVRDQQAFKGGELTKLSNVSAHTIQQAVSLAEVILIAAVPQAVKEIAAQLGDISQKIIIDAMNSVRTKPEPYSNTTEALMKLTNCVDIVKCFNTTGAENMANPIYGNQGIDMFYAGDSVKAKAVAKKLALDIGFENVYDFGGSDKYSLLEQFALSWINLAMMQSYGRGIAIKIVKR
ncbi:MAG: NADPH-dependent F420 reductase [Cytophagia bacterium]|nr:NADPH-dependent F420 reductase [Cytophagia bacterium]NBW36332.1 NADPH-dependent F420 reductase [Cytophagia bacterium]